MKNTKKPLVIMAAAGAAAASTLKEVQGDSRESGRRHRGK